MVRTVPYHTERYNGLPPVSLLPPFMVPRSARVRYGQLILVRCCDEFSHWSHHHGCYKLPESSHKRLDCSGFSRCGICVTYCSWSCKTRIMSSCVRRPIRAQSIRSIISFQWSFEIDLPPSLISSWLLWKGRSGKQYGCALASRRGACRSRNTGEGGREADSF